MRKLLISLSLVFIASCGFAQGIVGDWYGALKVPTGNLRLVFHISQNGDTYTTLMDSPDQGANGFASGVTTLTGNTINVDASARGITYTGTFLPDSNKIRGIFKQGGTSFPLSFFRTAIAAQSANVAPPRPQDPKDFPYKREEVAFNNPKGGDRLAGTLTMPSNGKASKIVVLITGSGPENRNEEVFDHRPFLVLSDWLTRHGIAVLRYDDRGVGKSTGVYATATTLELSDDAEAAVNYILSRPDLKNLSIGLMGHSEGGTIAPMVASRNKNVKFIILMAGAGVPMSQLMVKQVRDELSGSSPLLIDFYAGRNEVLYKILKQNTKDSPQVLKEKLDTGAVRFVRAHPEFPITSAQMPGLMTINTDLIQPWMRYFISINPEDYLVKVHCPVLAFDGTLDLQVNADANLAGIKVSLNKGGNHNVTIVKFDNLNHLMQKAQTGKIDEYEKINTTIEPEVLTTVSDWINKLK